jgi:hypothetical protein
MRGEALALRLGGVLAPCQRPFERLPQPREGSEVAVRIERLQPRRVRPPDRPLIVARRDAQFVPHRNILFFFGDSHEEVLIELVEQRRQRLAGGFDFVGLLPLDRRRHDAERAPDR